VTEHLRNRPEAQSTAVPLPSSSSQEERLSAVLTFVTTEYIILGIFASLVLVIE